jgi:hypothetical protein
MSKPVAVFQLDLEHAPLLNVFRRMHWAQESRLKKAIAVRILAQIGGRSEPLTGRPQILVTRYSAGRPRAKTNGGQIGPDQDSAGTKLWLDVLVRLGWLKDDAPDCIEVRSEWVKVPRGQGRVVVHIFTSEQANAAFEERNGW